MDRNRSFRLFIFTFAVAFLASAAASYLYGFLRHGGGPADWKTALRLAFILGVALTVTGFWGKR
jgi:hypothetical protein